MRLSPSPVKTQAWKPKCSPSPRKVFKSNTLEEYIAPFAHLLYALEMDSPAKFEEYSHVILERTYDIFLERYLAAYPDLPLPARGSLRLQPRRNHR